MRRSSWVTAAVGVAAAFALACGGTSSTGSTPQSPGAATEDATVATKNLGETITVKSFGSEYQVTVSNARDVASSNQFTQPKGKFLVFDVKIAVKQGAVFASPAMFHLVTSTGEVYSWALAIIPKVNQDWTVQLNPGQNKSGQVVLDVPKDVAGARIYIQELDKPGAYWKL